MRYHCGAISLCISMVILAACRPSSVPKWAGFSGRSSADAGLLADDKTQPKPVDLTKLDPAQAAVTLQLFTQSSLEGDLSTVTVSPHSSGIGSENPAKVEGAPAESPVVRAVEFPYLEVIFDGANFVKVMRCPLDYRQTFEEFKRNHSYDDVFATVKYEAFWTQSAHNDRTGCVYMGTHVVREQIFDVAAPTGHWFYLLNPCVSKEFSLSQKEGCSHRLVASEGLDYVSTAHQNAIEDAQKLDDVELQALGLRDTLLVLSHKISAEMEYCERVAAIDAHNEAVDQAWGNVLGAVIGAVVGVVLAPFLGPEAIRLGIHYGAKAFSDGKQKMQRYIDKLDCSKAQGYYDEFISQQEKVATLALESHAIRIRMVDHDSRLVYQHNTEIQNYYTNMAHCKCIP